MSNETGPAPTTTATMESFQPRSQAREDPAWVRWLLVGTTYLVIGVLVAVPLVHVFQQAFSAGIAGYFRNLCDRDTLHAIFLTLMVSPVAVAMNVVFGLAAAWAIARFQFPGRTVLISLIDLPMSISPVKSSISTPTSPSGCA